VAVETVLVNKPSNNALERTAGSHSLSAAAQRERSPHQAAERPRRRMTAGGH
jgi:hypothetical protein